MMYPVIAGITRLEELAQQATLKHLITTALVVVTVSVVKEYLSQPVYPDSLPRVGFGKGLWAGIKNYFLAYARHRAWVQEGYEKVCTTSLHQYREQ
jgi:hypothetical protein